MSVGDKAAAPASHNTKIRGYASRIGLAEPVIGGRFAPTRWLASSGRREIETRLRTPAVRFRPGFANSLALVEIEGAGKTGCALHPRSRVQDSARKRTRAYRFSGGSPAFPAQWFYGL